MLAVFDTFVLVFGLTPFWVDALTGINVSELHESLCKLQRFVFYYTSDVATWLICALTFDRVVAVCFPLSKNNVCTLTRAKICLAVLLFLALGKNTTTFFSKGAHVYNRGNKTYIDHCATIPEWRYFRYTIRPWIALFTVSIIPFVFILVCNIAIVWAIAKMQKLSKQMTQGKDDSSNVKQLTTMCLSVSFTFLVLVTPAISVLVARKYWVKTSHDKAIDYLLSKVSNLLIFVNNCTNFFLYSLTGTKFRLELKKMMCWIGPRQTSGTSASGSTTQFTRTNSNSEMSKSVGEVNSKGHIWACICTQVVCIVSLVHGMSKKAIHLGHSSLQHLISVDMLVLNERSFHEECKSRIIMLTLTRSG